MVNSANPMQGKVCVVTGATSGIGLVAAQALAQQGATLVVVARDPKRGADTVRRIQQAAGHSAVEMMLADLSVQAQVRQLACAIQQRFTRLDVLINNAGALFSRRQLSQDGLEMTFALNHLAYFLLTNLLLDLLRAAGSARVVNVSSEAHRHAHLDLSDLQGEHGYSGWRAYAGSKLANILFTYELARRLGQTGVVTNALHPGFVKTNFGRNNRGLSAALFRVLQLVALRPEKGAKTVIHLATSPQVEGITGKYFVRQQARRSSQASYDRATAERLWHVSAEWTRL
jgi:NAD(P)-dependent dehydrogenase (short-subunit alcohol dehydrogenase family)